MEFIRPVTITDANLISSTVTEDDHPEWVANQAYSTADLVIRTQTHRVYRATDNVNSSTPPELDTRNWADFGPTNRWAMFDDEINTATSVAESLTVVLQPGRINALSAIEVDCYTVTVDLEANEETVFSATYDLIDKNNNVGDWYGYFYEPIEQQNYLYISQLIDAALLEIPAYGEGVLTVTFSKPGGTVKVGALVTGLVYQIGPTENGVDVGITDYSIRKVDRFGQINVVARNASKDVKADVMCETRRLDNIFYTLYKLKDTPLVFIVAEQHGSMIVYGYSTWRIRRQNALITNLSMTIEGRT